MLLFFDIIENYMARSLRISLGFMMAGPELHVRNRARKSRTTLQNKVRLEVLPEQLTLFVNTSVTFKKCIIQQFSMISS